MPGNIELNHQTHHTIYPCPPFHFDGTVWKPSYYPSSDNAYEPGHFWQSMRFMDQLYGIRMDGCGSESTPALEVTIYSKEPLTYDQVQAITDEITWRYNLDADLSGFYNGCAQDPCLAPVLQRWRGVRPSSYTSLYEYLVIATLLQNATVRRTVQMSENLFNRFGTRLAFDGREFAGYWGPDAIQAATEEELRALKLGYRAKTLKRQAESFTGPNLLNETQLRELPTPLLKKTLLSIYGVGPASVWYLLFGQFKRYDAFEYISPWEQKIYSRLLFDQELVEAKTILAEVERRWGPYKMLAAHLIFEDLFWQRRNQSIPWLEELIRL